MSIYDDRIRQDETLIREQIEDVARKVQYQLQCAVRALLSGDHQLAAESVLGDFAINRKIREIDHICLQFVARHLPTAGHLRFVTAVRRLTIEIERIGDYAASIGRSASFLSAPPPTASLRNVELMADHAERVLAEAIESFLEGNAERARGVRALSGQMESTYHRALVDLIRSTDKGEIAGADLIAMQSILNRLERVSDQSKNICEETIFAVTGEGKPDKVYRILFVDEDHGLLSRMSEAIARRDFPIGADVRSAGLSTDSSSPPSDTITQFFESKDLRVGRSEAEMLIPLYDALSDYHFIVSFAGPLRGRLEELPFQTLVLDWSAGPDSQATVQTTEGLETTYAELVERIGDLVRTLQGEDAS